MKLKRLFFLILGCVCLALGCVGIVLPVLPTVPTRRKSCTHGFSAQSSIKSTSTHS